MSRWVFWLGFLGLLAVACQGSRVTVRDHAVTSCRQAGYLGAVEDAGIWYCFKDQLGVPPVMSKP